MSQMLQALEKAGLIAKKEEVKVKVRQEHGMRNFTHENFQKFLKALQENGFRVVNFIPAKEVGSVRGEGAANRLVCINDCLIHSELALANTFMNGFLNENWAGDPNDTHKTAAEAIEIAKRVFV